MSIVNNFPPASSSGIFPGMILMWSGTIDTIPGGWQLCDGTNGTPNLVDRFIVGAGHGYAVGNTGGSDSVTLTTDQMPSHTHTISSSGSHTHKLYYYYDIDDSYWESRTYRKGLSIRGEDANEELYGVDNYTGSNYSYVNTNRSTADGDHTHTPGSTGSGSSHENRPPYYALAYIMKM